jgi:hypothetical protein
VRGKGKEEGAGKEGGTGAAPKRAAAKRVVAKKRLRIPMMPPVYSEMIPPIVPG